MRRRFRIAAAAGICALAAVLPRVSAETVRIALPEETAVFRPGPGADIANAFCLTCHSADYIATQPLLPPAVWRAIVEKMAAKFGAPIPPERVDAIVAYLVRTYSADNPRPEMGGSATTPTGSPTARIP